MPNSGAEGFETSLGPWTAAGPPDRQPGAARRLGAQPGPVPVRTSAVTTRDTVLLGFGLEHVPAAADRKRIIGKALSALGH